MPKAIVTVAHSTPERPRKGEGDVIELADGRLLLVYMEFAGQGDDFATTRLVAQESADGGHTWSGHRPIADTAPGDVNIYSPNLIRARDGGILLTFMRKHQRDPVIGSVYTWKSTDEGQTFSPLSHALPGPEKPDLYYPLCNAVVKRLASGRLILPLGRRCGALLSDDDGVTWRESVDTLYLPMRGVMETHVEQVDDGRVLMVMRNQLGSLFMSESADEGDTWSKPQTTGLRTPESCPELTRIPTTGDLLMIWNNSPYDPAFRSHFGKRSPLTSAVSTDQGRTWSHIRDIEDDPTRAFSNPGCRFTRRGQAIINYWTCVYLPTWNMQDVIDLRVAVIDPDWFYGR